MSKSLSTLDFIDKTDGFDASSEHVIESRAARPEKMASAAPGTIDDVIGGAVQALPRENAAPSQLQAGSLSQAPGSTTTQTTIGQSGVTGAPANASPFIVFLTDAPGGGGVGQRAQALLKSLGGAGIPTKVFDQLNGFVVHLTSTQAQRLRGLGGVQSVEADAKVFLQPPITAASGATSQQRDNITGQVLTSYSNLTQINGEIVPWGVRAVWQGQDISSKGDVASGTVAFVIDSGVSSRTGDLNIASSWHKSWIPGEDPFTDGNGHGTHVSGTIAAKVNGEGVVGVAPGAQIVSLKVFNSSGAGASYSTIIDAINYAASVINTSTNGLAKNNVVINMSLGGGFSSSLDTAVRNAANKGIRFSLAAGNDGRDADGYSPAAAGDHANVFTASAVDSNYRMAYFSNWDRKDKRDTVDDVDVAAPGVGVLSYNGATGQLASWGGTSMASPHVAGLLLMGGVTSGDLVTPYYSGTADPFAWGNSSVFPA